MTLPPPTPPSSFTCPRCEITSYSPDDIAAGYCGACHDWTRDSLRIRLYVGGELADELWVSDQANAGRAGPRHMAAALEADRDGKTWMVEVFDPAAPPDSAYMRFGTDAAGMVQPHEVKRWPWL